MPFYTESPRKRASRMELGVGERLIFTVDWGQRYLQAGQAITASTWDDPDGLTVVASEFSDTLSSVTLEWDTVAIPDPLDRTVKITNTVTVDDDEQVKAVLEIVGVTNTGVEV